MQRKLSCLILAIAVVLIASCGHGDKSAIAIPKDAGVVVHINTNSLTSKLSWKEIQATNWYQKALGASKDDASKKLLENPEGSGVDLKADLVFFTKIHGTKGYSAFEGQLKDPAAFEAFNKQLKPSLKSTKDGDLTVLTLENDAIAVYGAGSFIYLANLNSGYNADDYSSDGSKKSSSTESLIATAKSLYALKSDSSLSSDDRYTSLVKGNGDIHMWVNSEALSNNMMNGMLSGLNLGVLFKGNISAISLSFDNGKIDATSKSYYNKELAALYDKYKMKNIDEAMLSHIASDSVVGVFSMNYPPEGLKPFLALIGADGLVNGFLGDVGYSIDEFAKANKGDIIAAVTDLSMKTETISYPGYEEGAKPYTYTKSTPVMKWIFGVSINDKPAFDKLISVVSAKIGDNAKTFVPDLAYAVNDKFFALGNNQQLVDQFVAGSVSKKHAFISQLSGHPVGMYIDLQKVIAAGQQAANDSTTKAIAAESLKVWEDVITTASEPGNNSVGGHFVINFVDKNTNSLKQLNQYIDKLSLLQKGL